MASGKLWYGEDGGLNITGDFSGDDALAELVRELRRLARYAATIADGDAGAEVLRARIAALAGFAVILTWEFTPPTGEVVTRVNTTPRHNLKPVAAVLDKVVRTTHAMTAEAAEQLATTLDDYVGVYHPLASRDGRGYVVDHRTKVLLLAHTLFDLWRGMVCVKDAHRNLDSLRDRRTQAEIPTRRTTPEQLVRNLQSWDDMILKAHKECAPKGYALLPLLQTALDTVPGVDEIVAPGWDGRPPDWDTKVVATLQMLDSLVRGTLGLSGGTGAQFDDALAFIAEISNALRCRAELLLPVEPTMNAKQTTADAAAPAADSDVDRLLRVRARFADLLKRRPTLRERVRAGYKRYRELVRAWEQESEQRRTKRAASVRRLLARGLLCDEDPQTQHQHEVEFIDGLFPKGLVEEWVEQATSRSPGLQKRLAKAALAAFDLGERARKATKEEREAIRRSQMRKQKSETYVQFQIQVEYVPPPDTDPPEHPAELTWESFQRLPRRDRLALALARLGLLHDARSHDPIITPEPLPVPIEGQDLRPHMDFDRLAVYTPTNGSQEPPELRPRHLPPDLAESLMELVENEFAGRGGRPPREGKTRRRIPFNMSRLRPNARSLWKALKGSCKSAEQLQNEVETSVAEIRNCVHEIRREFGSRSLGCKRGKGYWRPDAPPDWDTVPTIKIKRRYRASTSRA